MNNLNVIPENLLVCFNHLKSYKFPTRTLSSITTDIFSSVTSTLFIGQYITMTDLITGRNKGSTCPAPVQTR